jgi:hypothetical protein
MSDEQDTQKPSSPEYQEYIEAIKAYDNPEVFYDPNLPQIYKFRIVNTLLPGTPDVFRLEVNGEILHDLFLETVIGLMRQDPAAENRIRELHGDKDLDEYRARLLEDKEYLDAEQEMYRLFVRSLPNLMMRFYEIIVLTSIFGAGLRTGNEQPAERNETEKMLRTTLNQLLRTLEKDIKRILATRRKGRPRKYEGIGDRAPDVARKVWQVACEMMGESRGIEAVPGLKEIAHALGTSENALGKQLTRAKWPWTKIKDVLAHQT